MQDEFIFLQNTRLIKKALHLSSKDYLQAFGMTHKEAANHLLNPKSFPVTYAMSFCDYFGLDLEILFSKDFNLQTFLRNYHNNEIFFPEHYQKEHNSRAITLINITQGLNEAGHSWLNEMIFRKLQIPKKILFFPELNVPNKLIVDYLALVEKYRTDLSILKYCGQQGILNLNKTFNFVTPSTSFSNVFYEQFFTDKIKLFDKTYDYKISKLKNNELSLRCLLKEELKDLYQTNTLSNMAFVNYKMGVASGLSSLFGMDSSETKLIKKEEDCGHDEILIKIPRQPLIYHKYLH